MFKFLSNKEQIIRERRKVELLSARQDSVEVATSVAFVTLAEGGSIDDVTATEHTDLFTPWVSGVAYAVGALRQYNNELYRCVQAHTSQDDWTPDAAASLWRKVGNPAEEYPAWSQPIGSHDAYATGDKVTHNDKKWVSTCDANVWEPGVYGWERVTADEDGTIDNPITAAAGMRYFKDKYYLDGGKIYRCTRDDSNGQGTILHYVPSQLVGIYFEEAE